MEESSQKGSEGNNPFQSIDPQIMELVPGYLINREKEMSVLRNSLESNDFETIEMIGHRLKGNGPSYGFIKIGELGKDLEKAAREQNNESLKELIDELGFFIVKAAEALQDLDQSSL
jgi:histidine phosphotransfer protein HptB